MHPICKAFVISTCLLLSGPAVTFANEDALAAPAVGGQRNPSGCLIGAGESYSTLRQSCVRLFETAIRLNPKARQDSAVMSAFILFASNDSEGDVELFLPAQEKSTMMKQTQGDNAGRWTATGLVLSYWKGMYTLDDANGSSLYQGASTP